MCDNYNEDTGMCRVLGAYVSKNKHRGACVKNKNFQERGTEPKHKRRQSQTFPECHCSIHPVEPVEPITAAQKVAEIDREMEKVREDVIKATAVPAEHTGAADTATAAEVRMKQDSLLHRVVDMLRQIFK